MVHIIDPSQLLPFDPYEACMSDLAYKRLRTSYYAVFRFIILELMPTDKLAENFNEIIGCPTKELYSMAGLQLLKEYNNWTREQAVDAYLYDDRVRYALNLDRDGASLCERTLDRYTKLLRDDALAQEIFDSITQKLIEELDLKVDRQRLDSTHVFSDMATFSRTRLMGVTIRRFLVQLKRNHKGKYEDLSEELRLRYEKKENALFADVQKDTGKRSSLRQDVAEQMLQLIQVFSGDAKVESMGTFKTLVKVFDQQCEIIQPVKIKADDKPDDKSGGPKEEPKEEVVVRKKTGGDVIQNPSDLDATYCGHKGVGYQLQLAETCNPDNEVQIFTAAICETAVDSDANALIPVLEELEAKGRKPETMLADTLYGSDENVVKAKENDIDLISPVGGPPPKKLPEKPTPKQLRLQARRELQAREEWRDEFKARAQIEGSIGSCKRRTGLAKLRFRGKVSVFPSMILKAVGTSICRATASVRIQQKIASFY